MIESFWPKQRAESGYSMLTILALYRKPTSGAVHLPPNQVTPLSTHCRSYDFVTQDGRTNIGAWIEAAARSAGR